MNRDTLILNQRLAILAYLVLSRKGQFPIDEKGFDQAVCDAVSTDYEFLFSISKFFNLASKTDEDASSKIPFLLFESSELRGARFRNLWNANGQIVYVDPAQTSRLVCTDPDKKRLVVNSLVVISQSEFWKTNKEDLNENCLQGVAYSKETEKLIIVCENAFGDWVDMFSEKVGVDCNQNENLSDKILKCIATICHVWENEFLSGEIKKVMNLNSDISGRNPRETSPSSKEHLISDERFVIFAGPPGTGKTRIAKGRAEKIGQEVEILQIHPSYCYEDLVEGIKPISFDDGEVRYDVVEGPLKIMAHKVQSNHFARILSRIRPSQERDKLEVCLPMGTAKRYDFIHLEMTGKQESIQKAQLARAGNEDKFIVSTEVFEQTTGIRVGNEFGAPLFMNLYYRDARWGSNQVIILDEINRGNIAQLLGELLYVIADVEADNPKPVTLQYSGEKFSWPNGLHLYATMNSSDTSTDRLDQALKRRFKIINCEPDPHVFSLEGNQFSFLQKMNDRKSKLPQLANIKISTIDDLMVELLDGEALSSVLESLNRELRLNKQEYNLININDKLIGQSYFIRFARVVCEAIPDNINIDKGEVFKEKVRYFAIDKARVMLKEELLPALLSVFHQDESNLLAFLSSKVCPNLELSEKEHLSIFDDKFVTELSVHLFFKGSKDRREDFDKRKKMNLKLAQGGR